MKKIQLLIFFYGCLLVSCTENQLVSPYVYNTNPKYTWGYVEYFGQEYAGYGIKNNLMSVSLFSDSLSIDSTAALVGTGQFLFLEDVYVSPTDKILQLKTYTISNSHEPYTVSPGKRDTVDTEVFPINAYITYYEENTAKSVIKYITEGTFTVSMTGSQYVFSCDFKTDDKKALKGTFTGKLGYADESLTPEISRVKGHPHFLYFPR